MKKLLLAVIFCFAAIFASAQRTAFYNLNVENGLIQSQVMAITQDNFGHLWIGTLGGLARFDGKNFTNYTIRDGMSENEVTGLAFDRTGKLWIGNPNAISSFNGRTFKIYKLETPGITKIKVDVDNKVWFFANNTVYNIEKDKIKQLDVPGSDSLRAYLPEKGGLWLATMNGKVIHIHDRKSDTLALPPVPFSTFAPFIIDFFKDKKGNIWLISGAGLLKVEGKQINFHKVKEQYVTFMAPYYSITEDMKGDLWIGAQSGVLRLAENSLIYYNKQSGISDNNYRSVFTDAEGNVWLGSDGQGIFRFSGSPFTVLDEAMGLKSGQIRSMVGDKYGTIYLGTMDAGLYKYENNKITNIYFPITPTPSISALAITRDGKLWLGTPGALYSNTPGQGFKQYKYPAYGLPLPSGVTALYADSRDRLWIGFGNSVYYYQNDSFHKASNENIFARAFKEISPDSILIATNDNGLALFNEGKLDYLKTETVLDSSALLCLTVRNNHELWIGTSDNGVIRYNMKTGEASGINKSNGLRSDFIYNIITDDNGDVWAGTGFGIHKISINDEDKPVIKFFGKNQGVTGMESNHNAVYKMADGSIWFGTTNGALHYQPQSQTTDAKPLSIVLQSVKVFGEAITDTSYFDSTEAWYNVPYELHLPPKKNNITFTFQAISLSGGNEQITYRYRIEGLDAPWSDWSPTNSVTFSALPSGKYTLHVESNTGGELHYEFEIITPFHKTGWFRLLILAGCILLGITIQYIANRIKQNRQQLIERTRREEQNRVRQRTAEDFHDEVGNKLTRINVLANVLKNKIQLTPETQRIIGQIEDNTAQLYSGTKDILWSLKPSNDGLYEILHRIRDFGGELFQDTDIDFVFLGTDMRWRDYKLPMDVSRNLIMIFKEALNNSLKYSKATKIELDIRIKMRNVLQLTLKDNGNGFDMQNTKRGHGIDNMQVRAKRIHGRFYIDSKPGKGTIINLAFRLPPKEKRSEKKRRN